MSFYPSVALFILFFLCEIFSIPCSPSSPSIQESVQVLHPVGGITRTFKANWVPLYFLSILKYCYHWFYCGILKLYIFFSTSIQTVSSQGHYHHYSLRAQHSATHRIDNTINTCRTEIEHYSITVLLFHLKNFFCIPLYYSVSLIFYLTEIDNFSFNLPFIFQILSELLSFKMLLNIACVLYLFFYHKREYDNDFIHIK